MSSNIRAGTLQVMRAAVALGFAFAAGSSLAAATYSEDWSAGDANGWIGNTSSTVVARDSGVGNPAGSLESHRDLAVNPSFRTIGATTELAAASGSYLGAPRWMISFDVKYDDGNFIDALLRFRYRDSSFNGWVFDLANAFPSGWNSYSVTFDSNWTDAQAIANGWVQESSSASWQALMGDVYHPEIRLELGNDNSAQAHIDNFAIEAIPEPASLALLGLGLAGLGFSRRKSVQA